MKKKFALAAIALFSVATLTVGVTAASASPTKKTKVVVCAGKTKPAATKAIKTAYDKILNGSLGLTGEQKAEFLQFASGKKVNTEFRDAFIADSLKNGAAAGTTSVVVNSVTCKGKKAADVDFDLVLGGKPAAGLAPAGTAVLDDNVWKVSGVTMCDLQALGNPAVLESDPCLTILASS